MCGIDTQRFRSCVDTGAEVIIAAAGNIANTPTIIVTYAGDIIVTYAGDIIFAGAVVIIAAAWNVANTPTIVVTYAGVTIAPARAIRFAGAGDVGFARARGFLLSRFVNDGQVNFEILAGNFDHSLERTRVEPVRRDQGHAHGGDLTWRQVG